MAKRNSNQTPEIYGIAKIVTVETELISGKCVAYIPCIKKLNCQIFYMTTKKHNKRQEHPSSS